MKSLPIVALLMCITLASSATVSPNVFGNAVQKILTGQAGIEALCAPTCGSSCKFLAHTCVNIKGLINCADQVSLCNANCAKLCGCLNDCPTFCKEDCKAGNLVEQLFCQNRVATCTGICQTRCPLDYFTEQVMLSLNQITQGLNSLLNPGGASTV